MGLLGYVLHRIKPPLAMGLRVGKLALRCIATGPRPLRLAEKIGAFVLDVKRPKLGLAYWLAKTLVGKGRSIFQVQHALEAAGCDDEVEDLRVRGMSPKDVLLGVETLEAAGREEQGSLVAYKFAEAMLNKRAVHAGVAARYNVAGQFNIVEALTDFYTSPRAVDFADVVLQRGWRQRRRRRRKQRELQQQQGGAAVAVAAAVDQGPSKEEVMEAAMHVWDEITTRVRDELIDFFVL